jgi:uncharacterized protein YndB with AHSA1/START domain
MAEILACTVAASNVERYFDPEGFVMKWTLVVVGGLVAVVLLVVVIGAMLPRDHVASTSAVVAAPPQAVWNVVSDPASAASWRDVQRVEMLSTGGATRWREFSKHGAITMEQMEALAPSRFVTRIADTDLGFGGTWTIALAPEGTGTRVTIREDGFVSNPLFRFMSRFVFGHYGTQEAYLRALGRKFGHDVNIERRT